ncbi:HD-GYP domain-containing protein [Paenibacillus barcinonensis]|uniref:HD domain-containing protein n=1 Tax=Paenibacillus barcinonensis TaxID=198119 RepID=A0A2V4W2I6_PAEBA|nr:HD-GYP domain-containing protein [Paenibacillus barcinonensis]PYE48710.1 HD domain-containing protein [Paenibacillus barcinonensis]QKS57856.1 HD-GYP domain-containing protein [Paenibacillus barcinonensis]
MGLITLSEVKPGLKLGSDVQTLRGNVLLQKGKVILPKDVEVLRAFMIHQIDIEQDKVGAGSNSSSKGAAASGTTVATEKSGERTGTLVSAPVSTLQDEYEKMVILTKNAFLSSLAAELPVYELRTQLETLFGHLKQYNVLTFSPRAMKEHDYIYHHAVLSAITSYQLAQWLDLPSKDWMQVAFAGLFHDIGNNKVDPQILHKPSSLTAEEQEEIRQHTKYGYQILKQAKAINEGARLAALQHHEKVDGSGYPLHLTGTQIHIYAKIVAIADIFHAMTLDRIYRKAQSPYRVLDQIQSEAFGKLDPSIVNAFVQRSTQIHNGIRVKLSNNQIGEIVFSDRDHPTRPMVSVEGTIINLMQQRQLYIQEVLG